MIFSSNQIGLQSATVYDISAADLTGANSGQRPDLLAKTSAIFRTPDSKTYAANADRTLLVAASLPVTAAVNEAGVVTGLKAGGQDINVGGSSTEPAWLNIANRGEAPQGLVTLTSPRLRAISRREYIARENATSVKAVFANRYSPAGTETDGPTGVSIVACAVEVNGVTTKMTFAGADGVALPPGTVDLLTDAATVAISKGDIVYVRTVFDTATGFIGDGMNWVGDTVLAYDPLNENNQVYSAGPLTTPTGGTTTNSMGPVMLIGEVPEGTVSLLGVGDSIGRGSQDTNINSTGAEGGGPFRRAGIAANIPCAVYATSAKTLATVASNNALLLSMAKYCTYSWVELGTNDITASNLTTVQSTYTNVWGQLKTAMKGAKHVSQFSILPRVSTTDGVTTLANQTPVAGFAAGGTRDGLNMWFPSKVTDGTINLFLDWSAAVEDPTDSNKWAIRTFATTLAAAYASGSTVSMTKPPKYGEMVVLNPAVLPSTGTAMVRSYTGTASPFVVTLSHNPAVAAASGDPVKATPAIDGIHPSGLVYKERLMPVLLAGFAAR